MPRIARGVARGRQAPAAATLLVPLTIVVWREDGHWLSECREFDIASFGKDPDDAADQAMDAVCSYLNALEALGEREQVFADRSIVTYISSPAEVHFAHLPRAVVERESLQVRHRELPLTMTPA